MEPTLNIQLSPNYSDGRQGTPVRRIALDKGTEFSPFSLFVVWSIFSYLNTLTYIVTVDRVSLKNFFGGMFSYVSRLVNKFKVFDSVIGLNVILVMNELFATKCPTKMLFHNLSVQKLSSLVISEVTHLSQVITAFIFGLIKAGSTAFSGLQFKFSRTVNTYSHNIYPTTGRKVIQ